MVKMFSA